MVAGDGKVKLNRDTVNGAEPILKLIGGLPTGTLVTFESARFHSAHLQCALCCCPRRRMTLSQLVTRRGQGLARPSGPDGWRRRRGGGGGAGGPLIRQFKDDMRDWTLS